MSLIRFDPFAELEDVSTRLNRLFSRPLDRPALDTDSALLADFSPAVDVQETDAEYLLKADLPDVKKDDVTVEIVDGTLSVRGERHKEKEEKGKRFHRIERQYGRFERRLAMPSGIDTGRVAAEFKDGVLKVHLPKSAEAKPKSIEVSVS